MAPMMPPMRWMKTLWLLLLLAAPAAAQSTAADALRRDVDFARSKVYPALVNIAVVGQRYVGGRARRYPGAGSGVSISAAAVPYPHLTLPTKTTEQIP